MSPLRPCPACPATTVLGLELEVVMVRCADELWIAVRGELDLVTRDLLTAALRRVEPGELAGLHLQLAGLRFCDVAGVRQLFGLADRVRGQGAQVKVHGVTPSVRKVACLLGADAALTGRGRTPA